MTTPPLRPAWVGWAYGLIATLAFSVAPPIARAAILEGMNPTAMLVVRMALATLLLGLTIAVTNRKLLWADWRCTLIALAAGAGNGVGMLSYFWALTRMHASIVSMLFSVSPLFVLGLLALRGEKVTYRHLARLALALGGMYLLIGPGGDVDLVGVLLVSISIVAFGVQLVLIQWYLAGYDARTVTFYIAAAIVTVIVAWWLINGRPWSAPGVRGWLAVLVLAVVSTYLARLTFFAAIGRIGGGQMALLTPLEILLTVMWSILFLGERLSPLQWWGSVLILGSAALAIQRVGRASDLSRKI